MELLHLTCAASNPLKALLAAVALNLGGVVPHHITYNEARRRAAQNWIWSVGPALNSEKFEEFFPCNLPLLLICMQATVRSRTRRAARISLSSSSMSPTAIVLSLTLASPSAYLFYFSVSSSFRCSCHFLLRLFPLLSLSLSGSLL